MFAQGVPPPEKGGPPGKFSGYTHASRSTKVPVPQSPDVRRTLAICLLPPNLPAARGDYPSPMDRKCNAHNLVCPQVWDTHSRSAIEYID